MEEEQQWRKPSWNSRQFGEARVKHLYWVAGREGDWGKDKTENQVKAGTSKGLE